MSLMLIVSYVPAFSAQAEESDGGGQVVKIGAIEYDPDFKTFEQWKTVVPDLNQFEITQDGEFVSYGNDTYGSRLLFPVCHI